MIARNDAMAQSILNTPKQTPKSCADDRRIWASETRDGDPERIAYLRPETKQINL